MWEISNLESKKKIPFDPRHKMCLSDSIFRSHAYARIKNSIQQTRVVCVRFTKEMKTEQNIRVEAL